MIDRENELADQAMHRYLQEESRVSRDRTRVMIVAIIAVAFWALVLGALSVM